MQILKPHHRHAESKPLQGRSSRNLGFNKRFGGLWCDLKFVVIIIQLLSHVRLFVTPWIPACQASLSITTSRSLLKLMSIESVMPSNHLILCHPFLLLPSIFHSIRVLSSEHHMAKVLELHPEEYSGLISFRMDWLDLLAVQWTLKSLLQHHSSKASILGSSAFFMVQLSHPYMTTGKTIALTRRTFVSEVTSLCFENHFLNPDETSKVTGNTGIILKGRYMAC